MYDKNVIYLTMIVYYDIFDNDSEWIYIKIIKMK